jgi:uncharacterized protein (DUF924 family)
MEINGPIINNYPILDFWFPDDEYHVWWFKSNEKLDNQIHNQYYQLITNTFDNFDLEKYNGYSIQKLIQDIIILDQFSRNINRILNNINISEFTNKAIQLSNLWIHNKYYLSQPIKWTVFAFLPIRHSKDSQLIKKLIDILDEMELKDSSISSDKIYQKFKLHTIRQLKL